MFTAGIVFAFALVSILALLVLKYWESRRGVLILAPLRRRADLQALRVQSVFGDSSTLLSNVPPFALRLVRMLLAFVMRSFARLAHAAGSRALWLADLVSHRHNFERRNTRSEFLKQVSVHRVQAGERKESDQTPE